MVREILKLGDPRLYEISSPVDIEDRDELNKWVSDLRDTLLDFRKKYGAGRAIAAPQIGVPKRLIYVSMDREYVILNPELSFPDSEKYALIDDCMSFPGLTVRVERYKRARLKYLDMEFMPREMELEGDWSELVQHEYDHLDGVLATMRAVDCKSFYMKPLKRF